MHVECIFYNKRYLFRHFSSRNFKHLEVPSVGLDKTNLPLLVLENCDSHLFTVKSYVTA